MEKDIKKIKATILKQFKNLMIEISPTKARELATTLNECSAIANEIANFSWRMDAALKDDSAQPISQLEWQISKQKYR